MRTSSVRKARFSATTPGTHCPYRLEERCHENSEPNISSEFSRCTSIQRKYEDCFRNCASGWVSAFRPLRLSGWQLHLPKTATSSQKRFSSPKVTAWPLRTRFSIRREKSLPRRLSAINQGPSLNLPAIALFSLVGCIRRSLSGSAVLRLPDEKRGHAKLRSALRRYRKRRYSSC